MKVLFGVGFVVLLVWCILGVLVELIMSCLFVFCSVCI